jgi:two-component system, NarL family, nitrate/nitrite response regulator NarL
MDGLWDVMLVDGDRLFSAAVSALLADTPFTPGLAVGTLGEAAAALRRGARPDLMLVAIDRSQVETWRDPLRELRDLAPDARLVLLGEVLSQPLLTLALQVGAEGCLHKDITGDALRRAMHLVRLGMTVFPTSVAELLDDGGDGEIPPDTSEAGELSRRELEILRCLLAGQSNKAIARQLDITESTVKMHFKNLMRKIRAQNRTQAAVWAIQHGLAAPSADARGIARAGR